MMLHTCVLFFLATHLVSALDNGVARTPPMGWMSWERFRCNVDCKNDPKNCISENLYKEMADRMASDGYQGAGYQYVSIDDCWMTKERDAQGRLVPDPDRFPSGIKALADYVHSKGLKLGIYEDFGTFTCGGYPGSEFHIETDAQTFAEWGVDALKLDGCNSNYKDMPVGYAAMGKALNKTGRPIMYSCSWPVYWVVQNVTPNYTEIGELCNLWRNWYDIEDSWDSVSSIIDYFAADKGNFTAVAAPGRWNDPDMLILGDFGLSYQQQRTQMAMWAIMAAPLYMSDDLRTISNESRSLLLNANIISINQDPLGIQGRRVLQRNNMEAWARPLHLQAWAVLVFNRQTDGEPTPFTESFKNMGVKGYDQYKVYEAFTAKLLGQYKVTDDFTTTVDPSGSVQMFYLSPASGEPGL